MDNSFGKRLSYVMNMKNMRQKELAKAADVTEATVSRYVNNKRSPDIDFIRAIVPLLNVSADFLLGFSDEVSQEVERDNSPSAGRYSIVREDGASVRIEDPGQIKLLDQFFLSLV